MITNKKSLKFTLSIISILLIMAIITGCDSGPETSTYDLNLNKEGEGEIIVEPDEELYDEDTTVSLTAEPEEDWDFAYWEGLKNTKAETKVVMDSDKTINGIFGEILFEDDFSDDSSGWSTGKTESDVDDDDEKETTGEFKYTDNEKYSIKILEPDYSVWDYLPIDEYPGNYLIEFDAQFAEDDFAKDNYGNYGIIFNYEDKSNYSWFVINSHGKYAIVDKEDEPDMIVDWTSDEEINTEENLLNKITLLKIKDDYYFYINDKLIEKVSIETNSDASIGLMGSSSDNSEPPVEVLFDNFKALDLSN